MVHKPHQWSLCSPLGFFVSRVCLWICCHLIKRVYANSCNFKGTTVGIHTCTCISIVPPDIQPSRFLKKCFSLSSWQLPTSWESSYWIFLIVVSWSHRQHAWCTCWYNIHVCMCHTPFDTAHSWSIVLNDVWGKNQKEANLLNCILLVCNQCPRVTCI